MPQSSTNRASLYVSEEAAYGETPGAGALAPRGYELRMTGESLQHQKQTVVSNTIRQDRQRDAISEVGVSSSGDVNFEMVFRDLEILLAGAFANDPRHLIERSQTSGQLAVATANNRYTGPAGTGANLVVGQDVWVTGFTANKKQNGRFKVAAAASTTFDFDATDAGFSAATETSSAATTVKTAAGVFTDIGFSAATLTSTTTNFLTSVNLAVGQWIRLAGSANPANVGIFRITAIAANLLTLATSSGAAAFTTEAAGASIRLTAKRLTNGVMDKTFQVEKKFTDVNRFHSYRGQQVNNFALTIEAQQLITGSFSFMGKENIPSATSVLGTITPAGTTPSINATANVGAVMEAGALLTTAIRGITLSVANNLRSRAAVANRAPISQGLGFVDVTGTINAYFEDDTLYNKLINHTSTSLSFRLTDPLGNVMVFTLPNLYFTAGNPQVSGPNDDVMAPLEFTAIRDSVSSATIIVDILPV